MVDNYAAFFNCTPVGHGPDIKLFILVGWGRSFLSVAWPIEVQLYLEKQLRDMVFVSISLLKV